LVEDLLEGKAGITIVTSDTNNRVKKRKPKTLILHPCCVGTTSGSDGAWSGLRTSALSFLQQQATTLQGCPVLPHHLGLLTLDATLPQARSEDPEKFGIHPFYIPKGRQQDSVLVIYK
jgi:hypothetical protein